MATTTNYGWTTPDNTDLVKDGALAIRTLGSAIDTSMNTALGTKKAGLVLLNTTSFSGVTSTSCTQGLLSSTYKNYRLVINIDSIGADRTITFRFRKTGTDRTDSLYNWFQILNQSDNVAGNANGSAQTSFRIGTVYDANIISMEFANPTSTTQMKPMTCTVAAARTTTLAQAVYIGGAYGSTSNDADAFTIINSSGNFSGTYSLYGYNA